MAKRRNSIISLIIAILLGCASLTMMIISTVKSFQFGKSDFSHNLTVKKIVSDADVSANGVLHHYVVLDGVIRNNTNVDYKLISVEIVLSGVNNKTGEYAKFPSNFVIESLDGESSVDLTDETMKVGNKLGFIPESVEEVKLFVDGDVVTIGFEAGTDAYLIMFGISLVLIFVAGIFFVRWVKSREQQKKEINNN